MRAPMNTAHTDDRPRRRGLSRLEVLALSIGLIAVTVAVMRVVLEPDPHPLLAHFEDRYGEKSSRHGEEWMIRDFFQDRRNGTFLDVGANHYKKENNTYYLETTLGWSGLAVD